jgi:hypothetical protein
MATEQNTRLTRRAAMVAGLAAAAVPAVPALANGTDPDAIYAVIEAHRRAHQAFEKYLGGQHPRRSELAPEPGRA